MMTLSAQADLITLYLDANEGKLVWSQMQSWTVPEGWEQSDWQEIIDKLPIEAFKEAGNCKIEGYPLTKLRDLKVQLNGKLIAIQAKVIGRSALEPDPETIIYQCLSCDEVNYPVKSRLPVMCIKCGKQRFEAEVTEKTKNMQVYILQDGQQNLACIAKDEDLFYQVANGATAHAIGVLGYTPYYDAKEKTTRFRKSLRLAYIKATNHREVNLTPEDKIMIEELVQQPNYYETLVNSFAPHIMGEFRMKETAIYTLLSSMLPRPFNSILGGPPGRGKTEILKWTVAMHPNATKITLARASVPGLTASTETDPDTQARVTRIGLFGLYDRGFIGITELQAIKKKDSLQGDLNDALENKEISGAKADGEVQIQARCAVMFDTNNFMGGWDYIQSLARNLKFFESNLPAFLSRIDLIAIVPQHTDKEFYRKIAERNFEVSDTAEALEKYAEDYTAEDGSPRFGAIKQQKIFNYYLSLPLPKLQPELKKVFADNYVDVIENNPDYAADSRYNRGVRSLAMLHALVMLKAEGEEEDMKFSIDFINCGKDIETRQKDGTHDANEGRGLPPKTEITRRENMQDQFADAIEKATKAYDTSTDPLKPGEIQTYARHDDLMEQLRHLGWKESTAEQWIGNALYKGKLMEKFGQQKYSKA